MKRQPFHRPRTWLNSAVELFRRHFRARHTITTEQLHRWHIRSRKAFKQFVVYDEIVDRVQATPYTISERTDFDSAWSLEVVFDFDTQADPHINYFVHALWTCLPVPNAVFDWFGQTAVDHAYGHLYAYYAGRTTYGEDIACYCQYRAFGYHELCGAKLLALLVPVLHRWHKEIPFTNYMHSKHVHL